MTIDQNTWPNPPLQILDAAVDELPDWHHEWDMAPPWVHAVIKAWAHGLVPVVTAWSRLEEAWRYEIAFERRRRGVVLARRRRRDLDAGDCDGVD